MIIAILLVAWISVSLWWFGDHVGYGNREYGIIDNLLSPPVIILSWIAESVNYISKLFTKGE